MTRTIAERWTKLWDACVGVDAEAHSQYLTEDDRAVHPDGSVRLGRQSAAETAAAPIEDYWLADLQAWPVATRAQSCRIRQRWT